MSLLFVFKTTCPYSLQPAIHRQNTDEDTTNEPTSHASQRQNPFQGRFARAKNSRTLMADALHRPARSGKFQSCQPESHLCQQSFAPNWIPSKNQAKRGARKDTPCLADKPQSMPLPTLWDRASEDKEKATDAASSSELRNIGVYMYVCVCACVFVVVFAFGKLQQSYL